MGDKGWRFPRTLGTTIQLHYHETRAGDFVGPPAPPSGSQATRREPRGDSDGRQDWRYPRRHHPVPKLQDEREEKIMMEDWRFPQTPRERQEEILMGDKDWRFPWTTGTTIRFPSYNKRDKKEILLEKQGLAISRNPWHIRFQATRRETEGNDDGGEGLAISQATRRETEGDYHERQKLATSRAPGTTCFPPVPKLQEGEPEEVLMGDEDWRFPATLGTTIYLPSYKKRDKRRS